MLELHAVSHISPYLDELCTIFKEIGADFSFCADLIAGTENDAKVIMALSEVMEEQNWTHNWIISSGDRLQVNRKGWFVNSDRLVPATAQLLKHIEEFPSLIYIDLPPSSQVSQRKTSMLLTLLESIKTHFPGELRLQLRHSRDSFTPMDDVILALRGSKYDL